MRLAPGLLLASVLVLVGWLIRHEVGTWHVALFWPWSYVAAGVVLLLVVLEHVRWTGRMFATILGLASLTVGIWFASGDVPAATPGAGIYPWLLASGPLFLLGAVLSRFQGPRGFSAVGRWLQQRGRRGGFASRWQMFRVASGFAMRRKAKVMRPSLGQVSWLRRWFLTGTREFATCVARVRGQRIYSPIEEVTLRVGGPRTGKTGEIAGRILDAPGAVIATSTRTDLVKLTGPIRAGKGPVRVFNPSNLGSLASTVTFNPLAGCEVPETAVACAEDLLSGAAAPGHGEDMAFWTAQARRVLTALLHAAALSGGSMSDVLGWVADPTKATGPVQKSLRRSPQPAFELDAMQFLGTNDRTQSSICATIMPALGWMSNATAVAATTPTGTDTGTFDVAELLDGCGTVFLLGAEDGQTAPLVAALTGHIAREARRIAAEGPSGRLDPPLTLALDEAALICPVPLDRWTADMGGRGVTIHIAVQGRSQLRQKWGDDGAGTIMNNASTLLVFGATKDHEDLQAYSALTGERWEEVPTLDRDGHHAPQRVPTMTPAQISQLKAGRVLIVRRGMPCAVGKVRMAWKRHDVKAHQRRAAIAERWGRWNESRARWAGHATRARNATVAATTPAVRVVAQRVAARREQQTLQREYRSRGGAPASITRIHGNQIEPQHEDPAYSTTTDGGQQ